MRSDVLVWTTFDLGGRAGESSCSGGVAGAAADSREFFSVMPKKERKLNQ